MQEIQIPTGYKAININVVNNSITYELVEKFKQGDYVSIIENGIKYIVIYNRMIDSNHYFKVSLSCENNSIVKNTTAHIHRNNSLNEASKREIKILNTALSDKGLKYNHNTNELQALLLRAKKNTDFYYIDQLCKVITAKDKYDEYHDNLYNLGNYYTNKSKAKAKAITIRNSFNK